MNKYVLFDETTNTQLDTATIDFIVVRNEYDKKLVRQYFDLQIVGNTVTGNQRDRTPQEVISLDTQIEDYYSKISEQYDVILHDRPVYYLSGKEIVANPSQYVILAEIQTITVTYSRRVKLFGIKLWKKSKGHRELTTFRPVIESIEDTAKLRFTEEHVRSQGLFDYLLSQQDTTPALRLEEIKNYYKQLKPNAVYAVTKISDAPRVVANDALVDRNIFNIIPDNLFSTTFLQILQLNDVETQLSAYITDTAFNLNSYGTEESIIGISALSRHPGTVFEEFSRTYSLIGNVSGYTVDWQIRSFSSDTHDKFIPNGLSFTKVSETEARIIGIPLETWTDKNAKFIIRAEISDINTGEVLGVYTFVDSITINGTMTLQLMSNFESELYTVFDNALVRSSNVHGSPIDKIYRLWEVNVQNKSVTGPGARVRFAISSGALPPGFSLDADSGIIDWDKLYAIDLYSRPYFFRVQAEEQIIFDGTPYIRKGTKDFTILFEKPNVISVDRESGRI